MNLIKTHGGHFIFHLGKREKDLLFAAIKLYPLIPAAYPRSSQAPDPAERADSQKLLEEALATQRQENKMQLHALLNEPKRFQETRDGYRLTLSIQQVEWLLQVLNDVRVGSWLKAGSPDEKKGKPIKINLNTASCLWAMEVCGAFQMALLDALDRA